MGLVGKIQTVFDCIHNTFLLWMKGIKVPETTVIRGSIRIYGAKHPNIFFGDSITINSSVRSNVSGGQRTVFAVREKASLLIGDNAGISNSTVICHESITIGNGVQIGANNVIYDSDMHSVEYGDRIHVPDEKIKTAPVIIEDGAWICGHCIILKGVHIGKRSVVAAGSVVTHDIPEDELWGGNPCRFIRKINVGYALIDKKNKI